LWINSRKTQRIASPPEEGGEARGGGRGRGGEWREKVRVIEVNVGVDGAKSEIEVERRRCHE